MLRRSNNGYLVNGKLFPESCCNLASLDSEHAPTQRRRETGRRSRDSIFGALCLLCFDHHATRDTRSSAPISTPLLLILLLSARNAFISSLCRLGWPNEFRRSTNLSKQTRNISSWTQTVRINWRWKEESARNKSIKGATSFWNRAHDRLANL